MEMTDFNMWCWNSRIFRASARCRFQNDARVAVGNLTMTNHPIHMRLRLRGHMYRGGWVDRRRVAGGQHRTFGRRHARLRIDAKYAGDWAIHCHKSHHDERHGTRHPDLHRRQTSKDVAKRSGSSTRNTCRWVRPACPTWARWRWSFPENTIPMMTGWGPHGPIKWGHVLPSSGARGHSADDYADPGWYENRPNEAWEWTGELPDWTRADDAKTRSRRSTPNTDDSA